MPKDINEEEYNLYKKKLEQIYDLCKQCKQKVNSHLQKQDQLIGNCLIKQRTTKNSSQNIINAKLNGNLNGQDTTMLNGSGEARVKTHYRSKSSAARSFRDHYFYVIHS